MNDFLTLQEVPAVLKELTDGKWDIKYRQVQKYVVDGKLPSHPFGKSRYLILQKDVEDFADQWKRGEVGKVGRPKKDLAVEAAAQTAST